MNVRTVVLLGGPSAGKRMDVEVGLRFLRVIDPLRSVSYKPAHSASEAGENVRATVYRREQLRDGDALYYVYVAEGAGSVVELLINGYKGN